MAAGNGPAGVAVSPDGASVYVSQRRRHGVAVRRRSRWCALAQDPRHRGDRQRRGRGGGQPGRQNVYVTNLFDDAVSQYDVGAGGALAAKTPATAATGDGPAGVAVSLDGRSVYVTNVNGGSVSQYDVGAGGVLGPRRRRPWAAGSDPGGIAVGPRAKDGTAARFGCSPEVVVAGTRRPRGRDDRRSTTCTATVSDTAAGSRTTPSGTVRFAASGPGIFREGATCTLTQTGGGASSCHVTYRPIVTPSRFLRTDTLGAIYTGDPYMLPAAQRRR